MFFKYLTTFLVLMLCTMMFEVWRSGRSLRSARSSDGSHDAAVLSHHRGMLAALGCTTTLLIVLLETHMTTIASRADLYAAGGVLLYFHWLSDALLIVIATIIIVRFTGAKNRAWHTRLVYPAIALFLTTAITGLYLLFFRFPA